MDQVNDRLPYLLCKLATTMNIAFSGLGFAFIGHKFTTFIGETRNLNQYDALYFSPGMIFPLVIYLVWKKVELENFNNKHVSLDPSNWPLSNS